MKKIINSFLKSESGVITTEYLVLAAAAVVLGIAGVSGLSSVNGTTNEEARAAEKADVNITLQRFSSGN